MKNLLLLASLAASILITTNLPAQERRWDMPVLSATSVPTLPSGHRYRTNHLPVTVLREQVTTELIPRPRYYYAITPSGQLESIGRFETDAEALTLRGISQQEFINKHDSILCSDGPMDPATVRVVWQFNPGFHTRNKLDTVPFIPDTPKLPLLQTNSAVTKN